MVKLFCAVVGAAGRAFSVRVDEGDSVGDLKDAIAKKKLNKITCDADELQLYLAKRGDVWLTENDVKHVALDNQGNLRGFDMMHPTLWIKNDRYFGEKFQPNEGQIHVLVVVPTDDVAVPRSVPVAVPTRPEVNLASYDDLLTFLEGEMTDLSAVVSSPPILAQERLEFRLVGREQAIDTACRCFKDIVAHARTSALDHN